MVFTANLLAATSSFTSQMTPATGAGHLGQASIPPDPSHNVTITQRICSV